MASSTIIPTRMELTRLKRKLVTARKGYKLLKDKRDELMRQFLIMVRENRELREAVEKSIMEANRGFALARSSMSDEAVRVAFMAPKQRISIGVSYRNIMSVNVPEYSYETRTGNEADMFSYGFAFTSADLDGAVEQLSGVFDQMLKLAQTEKGCQLMAAEIEKTRRRVNALEHVLIPQLEEDIKFIAMKLDENERSSQIRLMKVKDMMLEQAHHYEEREAERAREKVKAAAGK